MSEHQVDSTYAWAVAAATLLMASLSFGAVTSVPILFEPIYREFGWSYALIASIHTSAMVGAGIGSIILGRILDKRGFLIIGLGAGLATGLGLVLASFATSIWQMYFAYGLLVGGIGQGAFFSPLAAAVSHWFDRHRALAVAIALSGQGVGGLLAPPLLRIAAERIGWRATLQGYGLFCTLAMVGAAFLYKPKAPKNLNVMASEILCVTPEPDQRKRSALQLCVALCCSNTATFGIAGHMVAYGEFVGFGPAGAAAIMSALFCITLISRLSVGYILSRIDAYKMLLVMSLLHMGGAWLLVTASSPFQLMAAVLFIGLGCGGYLPTYAAIVRRRFPAEDAGRRLTELYLLAFVGAGSGTWMVGAFRDLNGGAFDWGFLASAILASLACALLLNLQRVLNIAKSTS